MGTNRRGLLGLASLATLAGLRPAWAAGNDQLQFSDMKKPTATACLYHLDFGEPARFSQVLNNITNHYAVYDNDPKKIKLVLVTHSAGIKYFLTDLSGTPWEKETLDPAIYQRFVGLTKFGLETYLCQITFKRLNIDPEKAKVESFIKWVPSGVATVAELQKRGFGYLKVG